MNVRNQSKRGRGLTYGFTPRGERNQEGKKFISTHEIDSDTKPNVANNMVI